MKPGLTSTDHMQRIITISPPVISSELELKTFLGGICLEVVILTVNLIEAVYILGGRVLLWWR